MEIIKDSKTAYYHLPGLFEFYDFYSVFLPIFRTYREYFYDWCEIGSIYGAPSDCLWGGGRACFGDVNGEAVYKLMQEYKISSRLTFSNSLLKSEHLQDITCNNLCSIFEKGINVRNGIIIYSDLLLDYIKEHYEGFYFVSTTTKVLTEFDDFLKEINRKEYSYVVPDFRLNKQWNGLDKLKDELKSKVEFLCNECCFFGCTDRKKCYENVSLKNLGEQCDDFECTAPDGQNGYLFSKAMINPGFIGVDDIKNVYLQKGFTNFKIEGRGLGSAMLLEFILHYMTKPSYHINVREMVYLDSMLDLF